MNPQIHSRIRRCPYGVIYVWADAGGAALLLDHRNHRVRRLPVVDEGRLVGILSPQYLMRHIRSLRATVTGMMSGKVLVADDSGVMRKIIIRALNSVGVSDVVEAADGAQALDAFGKNKFDVVLTDWNMPNKSGLELLKDIRAQGSAVPVILITTEAEKSRVLEAIQAGATDYLAKPFEQDVLRAKLDKYVAV